MADTTTATATVAAIVPSNSEMLDNESEINEQPDSVVLETAMGPITVELYWNHAPRTCRNFATLSQRGYYDGVIFHRVIPGFVLQTGDPTGTGRGGDSCWGGSFADEVHAELWHSGAGVISMANAGPNTNRSQFFITLAPTPWLDGKHTIFGRVSAGMRTVQRISMVETRGVNSKGVADHRPKIDIKILRALPSNMQSKAILPNVPA